MTTAPEEVQGIPDIEIEEPGEDLRTDREILLAIDARLTSIETLVAAVATEVGPIVAQISNHPMLRMIFGKGKNDD